MPMTNKISLGDSLDILKQIPDNSIDSVVTDPPYGLSFMGKGWDTFKGNKEYAAWVEQWAAECLRVLKPGGHLLAFSGTRTYHALAWGVESAGFEIRDMIEWLYLSGFPKSMDAGKQFDKMAGVKREVVGVSPHTANRSADMGYHGGSVNEGSRLITAPATDLAKQWDGWGTALKPAHEPIVMARKPFQNTVAMNVEHWGTGAVNVDGCRLEPTGRYEQRNGANEFGQDVGWNDHNNRDTMYDGTKGRFPANCVTLDKDEWYSKYFNVSPQEVSKKASKKDRGEGNTHPTVKPVDLMAWLVRLVTPSGGIVLDPFAGSGSTLVAAKREGFQYIGIEREQEYAEIAEKRIESELNRLF